ncbi:hypothetical protein BO78DRAFT_314130, partial [Aspergillus sclerotiicarbonarius CBS 121057]
HTTTGCGEQGFPSAQPYLSHTPGANPFCCMFFFLQRLIQMGHDLILFSFVSPFVRLSSGRMVCLGTNPFWPSGLSSHFSRRF